MLRVPVLLHVPGRAQAVRGVTVAVSESGAMIVIPESLAAGTKFALENPSSAKKVSASVSRPARMTPEGALLPVEFGEWIAAAAGRCMDVRKKFRLKPQYNGVYFVR